MDEIDQKERVLLLVDDEQNIIRALTRMLRRDGYVLHTANSGVEALEILQQQEVGVIVSDQRMPGMTGTQLLSKAKDLYPDTVRIVLSGYTDLNSVTDAINEGAIYKFLTKPWDDDLIKANIEEAFHYYELKRENQRLKQELLKANNALEQRVKEKTEDLMFSVKTLQVAQDVLNQLPVCVLGIDDNGFITVANQLAHTSLSNVQAGLIGQQAEQILPNIYTQLKNTGDNALRLEHIMLGNQEYVMHSARLGRTSDAQGLVVVCIAESN